MNTSFRLQIICAVVLLAAPAAVALPGPMDQRPLEQAQEYARGGDWANTRRVVVDFLDRHVDVIAGAEDIGAMRSVYEQVREPWSRDEDYKGILQRIAAALSVPVEISPALRADAARPGEAIGRIADANPAFDGAASKDAFIASVQAAYPGAQVSFVGGPVREGVIPVKYDSSDRAFTFHEGMVRHLEHPERLAAVAVAEEKTRKEMILAARMGSVVTEELRRETFMGRVDEAQKASIFAAYAAVRAIQTEQEGQVLAERAAAQAAAAGAGVGEVMLRRFKDTWERFDLKGYAGGGTLYKNPVDDASPKSGVIGGFDVQARLLPLVPFLGRNVVTDKLFTDLEHYEFYGAGQKTGNIFTVGLGFNLFELYARYRQENYPAGSGTAGEFDSKSVGFRHKLINENDFKAWWGYELFKLSNAPFEGPVIGAFNAAHPTWPRAKVLTPNGGPNHLDLGYILSVGAEADVTHLVPADFPLREILGRTLHVDKTKVFFQADLRGSAIISDDPDSSWVHGGIKFLVGCRAYVGVVTSYGTDFSADAAGFRDNAGRQLKNLSSTMVFIEIPFEHGVDQCEKTPALPRIRPDGPLVVEKVETFHQFYQSGAATPLYRNGDEAQRRSMAHGLNVEIDKGPYELSASIYDVMGKQSSVAGMSATLAYNITKGLALEAKGLHEDGLGQGLNEGGIGLRLRPLYNKDNKITLEFVKALYSNVPSVIRANQFADAPNRSWYASALAQAKIFGYKDWGTMYGVVGAGMQGSSGIMSPDSITYGVGARMDFGPQEKPYVGVSVPLFGSVTQNMGFSSGISPVKTLGQGGIHDSPITVMANVKNIYEKLSGKTDRDKLKAEQDKAAAKEPPVPVLDLGADSTALPVP